MNLATASAFLSRWQTLESLEVHLDKEQEALTALTELENQLMSAK